MINVCRDTSDAVALYLPQRLYLKPFARLNISVQLPTQKVHGKAISNWEIMEKLRKVIQPDVFSSLKVTKHSSEVIRYIAELEQRDRLSRVLARLEDRVIQLNDYPDPLKVKVSEARLDFPTRHSWDSFFRDASDMDEMKPGERPDTVHISNLPIRWFVHDRDNHEDSPPSENIVKKVFDKYGSIRQVDIPAADPFRLQMKTQMRGISIPPQDSALYFESYIQFSEYVGFVRCMDALRAKKLLRKKDDLAEWCDIIVDFDKTKHMTDAAVKRRAIVRERLASRQKTKDDEERLEKERIEKSKAKERQKYERVEMEKLQKMREREERRKKKQLAKLMERDDVDLNSRVAEEQNKLLKAQKKLQAIRLIEELFKRIELRPELQRNGHRERLAASAAGERGARERLVQRCKAAQEDALQKQREHLRQALDGRIVIRSALETRKPARSRSRSRSSSPSPSPSPSPGRRVKTERLTTPERELEYNKATGMYGMANPYPYGFPYAAVPPPGFPYQASMYYPVRGAYYPPPAGEFAPRRGAGGGGAGFAGGGRRGRGWRGRGRGARMPYFDGPDASHQYYKYFKRLTEQESRNEHDDRRRSRSRSHSRRRSYTRSRSHSRRRSHTRSRSHSRRRSRSRSRSRNRRSRSHHSRSRSHRRSRSRSRSRKSRSRSRKSRSHERKSRSRSRKSRSHDRKSRSHDRKSRSRERKSRSHERKSRSRERRSRSRDRKTRSQSRSMRTPSPQAPQRCKSWSLPKDTDDKEAERWSKSPKEQA